MLLPRIWDEDLFENMDNWMSWPDESEFFGKKNPLYGKHAKNLMKTALSKALIKTKPIRRPASTFVRSVTQAAAPEHFMSAKPLNPRMFPRSLKTVSCSFTF